MRADLPTPALVLDTAALDRNIATMAAFARSHGLALRPHAKTHKSADIARRQIAAGAAGICCAKLSEAEALAAQGIGDIHLTSPIATREAATRFARLAGTTRLSVVADHPFHLDLLAGQHVTVLVDVDPGSHRTGVASPQAAVALAKASAAAGFHFGGVQFYCGSQQHITDLAERRAALADRAAYLRTVLAALDTAGIAVPVVTGGGTGSFAIDAELGLLTELQAGSYAFMDREYRDCDWTGPSFEQALFVDATVVSANHPGLVTIDAGIKAFATDAGLPAAPGGLTYGFTGDEHGALSGAALPNLGERIALVPPHCDPTVNLYDDYHLVDGDQVVGRWPITARGCSH